MVLPVSLMERYEQKYNFYSCTVPRMEQAALTCFLRDGYFERHLNRMRANYKAKHDFILNELQGLSGFSISGENAGIHLLLRSETGILEKELIERALKAGVLVYGLSEYYIEEAERREDTVILGYANLSEREIQEGIRILLKVWG